MGVPVLPPVDDLAKGPKISTSYSFPVALKAEIERQAAIDEYKSASAWLTDAVIAVIRMREKERSELEAKRLSR